MFLSTSSWAQCIFNVSFPHNVLLMLTFPYLDGHDVLIMFLSSSAVSIMYFMVSFPLASWTSCPFNVAFPSASWS
jgi:hypothetical protein